jgi:hypothetical protein
MQAIACAARLSIHGCRNGAWWGQQMVEAACLRSLFILFVKSSSISLDVLSMAEHTLALVAIASPRSAELAEP